VVVKIDDNEPNIFPVVDATDVSELPNKGGVEIVLITRIEGKAVRVRVRLDQQKTLRFRDQLKQVVGF
jgi:hypothetical protein